MSLSYVKRNINRDKLIIQNNAVNGKSSLVVKYSTLRFINILRVYSKFITSRLQSRFFFFFQKSASVILRLLGTKPQTRPKKIIIATSLRKKKRVSLTATNGIGQVGNTHKGCKLSIPNFEAIVPVIKGRRALPPAPQAAIHPTVPFTR